MDPITVKEAVIFVAGAAVGGLLSWLITHRYYVKAGTDQKAALKDLTAILQSGNTLERFEALLATLAGQDASSRTERLGSAI